MRRKSQPCQNGSKKFFKKLSKSFEKRLTSPIRCDIMNRLSNEAALTERQFGSMKIKNLIEGNELL